MTFLNAASLFGLTALAVPVILHLIHRQRYPERRFTTLRFFDVTVKHNVIQRRLIDRLLLLLRLLTLLLLVLALARPFWSAGTGDRSLALVVVLDNAPSLGRMHAGATLFAAGRTAAERLVAQLQPGDQAALLLTTPTYDSLFTTDRGALERQLAGREGRPTGLLIQGKDGPAPAAPALLRDMTTLRQALRQLPAGAPVALTGPGLLPEPRLSADHQALREQLARARLSTRPGDLDTAMRRAAAFLAAARGPDRILVVISDLQKSRWPAARDLELQGIKVVVVALETGPEAAPNLSLEECTVAARSVHFGQNVMGLARVRNNGSVKPAGAPALLVEAAGQRQAVKVNIPQLAPGATALVPFIVPAAGRGRTLVCTATLESAADPLAYDNAWHFEVPVAPPLRILCVHAAAGEATAQSGYYLVNALAPRGAGAVNAVFADVEECLAEELRKRDLFQYNVTVLAGVDTLETAARDRLRAFVDDGGGLLVFPGAKATPEACNGWGFLPARVVEAKTGGLVNVTAVSEDEPLMAELTTRLAGAERGLGAERWFRLEPQPGSTVLASLSNGAPALIGAARGKGRVILAAAGAHVDTGSSWPLRPAFVLLVRGLVQQLASTERASALALQRPAASGLATVIPHEMAGGTPGAFAVGLSAGALHYTPLPWLRDGARLLVPPQAAPGHYAVSMQPGSGAGGVLAAPGLGAAVTPMALNHGSGASELAALAPAEVKQRCRALRLELLSGTDAGINLNELSSGREMWRLLALAALVFMVTEGIVAWRSRSGAAA